MRLTAEQLREAISVVEDAQKKRMFGTQTVAYSIMIILRAVRAFADQQTQTESEIEIVARRPESCQHAVDGWRDHFGVLAGIWS